MTELLTEKQIDHTLDLGAEIMRLKKSMNAVILAHYYQEGELQDIADFVGDSLDLSRKAATTDADVIVFCGVKFMAEVAKILSPQKLVLLPDMKAGCSLEVSCPPSEFKEFRLRHPDHIALTYINCSAEVKALSDIIVTSSNAETIIRQIPQEQKIIFSPDKYLGNFMIHRTGRDMLLWDGTCQVHEQFSEKELVKLKTRHPKAHVIAHPECPPEILRHAGFVGSTSMMIKYAKENAPGEFIVITEPGILHQMHKNNPENIFFEVPGNEGSCAWCNTCPYMKLNTMEKLYLCMINRTPEVTMPEYVRLKAKQSLDRMLEMSLVVNR